MKNAFFACKPCNMKEYLEMREDAKEDGYYYEEPYHPIARVVLSRDEFDNFWNHFLRDRDWLKPYAETACGEDCVMVDCEKPINSVILVKTEGYNYGRYIAIVKRPAKEIA